jgi:hypothetical protein
MAGFSALHTAVGACLHTAVVRAANAKLLGFVDGLDVEWATEVAARA